MKYLAIDTETLGLDPVTCSLVEVAAVYDDGVSDVDELQTYRRVVINPTYKGEAYAMYMHGKQGIFKELATNKLTRVPCDAVSRHFKRISYFDLCEAHSAVHVDSLFDDFLHWSNKVGVHRDSNGKYIAAGKNVANFDFKFLAANGFIIGDVFSHRTLDPGSMWATAEDSTIPSLTECLLRAGHEKVVAHTALEDCFDVVKCIRAKWGIPLEGTR